MAKNVQNTKIKVIEKKPLAYFLNFLPALISALIIGLFALTVFIIRENVDGFVMDAAIWESLLTYIPMVIAAVMTAFVVRQAILSRFDLSVIGLEHKKSKMTFILVGISVVLAVLAFGFGAKTTYIKDDVICENRLFGAGTIKTYITPRTKCSLSDDGRYTITISNGRKYTAKKNSEAGKHIEKIFGI